MSTTTLPPTTRGAWRRAATDRHFLRHYAEMVAVMVLGMIVLGLPMGAALEAMSGTSLDDAPALMLLGMATTMTVPMVAWMRLKHGHGWPASLEMAASMFVPTLAAIAVLGAGLIESVDAILIAEHVVMLAAMYAVMLLRPAEYSRVV